MAFYDLPKQERASLVVDIYNTILKDLGSKGIEKIIGFFNHQDTYIRKSAYLSVGKIYFANKNLQKKILKILNSLYRHNDFKVRQTVINAAGEIGKVDFETVQFFFDEGLFDKH